jgi:hypothetical protein
MPEEAPKTPDKEAGSEPKKFEYTAFEKWNYKQVIHKTERKQSWRSLADSFFRASQDLVHGVVARELYGDVEGLAAIFLFRHYLELALKIIIINGRYLAKVDENAREAAKQVKRIHGLGELWKVVVSDSKPKLADGDWDKRDIASVEACIAEFDAVDPTGFAFRYTGAGSEFCLFDFRALAVQMEHIHQVLNGIDTYLLEAHHQNAEYDAMMEAEFGADLYQY